LAPKSVIFQNAWGVRKIGAWQFLHEYTTIGVISGKVLYEEQ
jgi:hypothetical protein